MTAQWMNETLMDEEMNGHKVIKLTFLECSFCFSSYLVSFSKLDYKYPSFENVPIQ